MSLLGSPLVANIAGETVALPPHEMPGEIEWWVEVLKWHVRKTFYFLASVPPSERIEKLLQVEQSLVSKSQFHTLEAQAVAEAALVSIQDVSDEDVANLTKARKLIDDQLATEWSALVSRYTKIILGEEPAEDAANVGPGDALVSSGDE
ncbi:hypothetical protein B0G75_103682 [Paraburkholderia sp. BL18I3N2]|nr:hypothetical protein B0G75_103682 [Paraburkholderia sp. BL18I3N2]